MSTETQFPWLNLDSKLYPEGRFRGLMICGLEWGGADAAHDPGAFREGASFFSDSAHGNPFRWKIASWFARWGHPMRSTDPGPFERCVVYTNWLATKAPDTAGRDLPVQLTMPEHADRFWRHVEVLQPRLILLFGSGSLVDAFERTQDAPVRRDALGPFRDANELLPASYEGPRHRSTHLAYGRCDVVGLPHPTERLTNRAIDAMSPRVSPLLEKLKSGLREDATASDHSVPSVARA